MPFLFQRFAAFLAPLTSGRINITVSAVYMSKVMHFSFSFLVDQITFYSFKFQQISPTYQAFNMLHYYINYLLSD